MAVFPSELKGILNHLLHQLEGLLDPGPGQGGEVHHRRVHLHCQKTHSILLPVVAPETVYLVQHRRMDQQEHAGSPPGMYDALPQGTPSWLHLFSNGSH